MLLFKQHSLQCNGFGQQLGNYSKFTNANVQIPYDAATPLMGVETSQNELEVESQGVISTPILIPHVSQQPRGGNNLNNHPQKMEKRNVADTHNAIILIF